MDQGAGEHKVDLAFAEEKATKTGTTIVGIRGKDFVVLAADTRSTNGPVVANKNCSKIHRIAENIYCCGAGTAADTRYTTKMAEHALYRFALKYNRIPRISHCVNMLKRHLFGYRGHVGAHLIVGGVDEAGVHLYGVHSHGSTDSLPYTTLGSGSYAAIGILESEWKENLSEQEATELAARAVEAGIRNDLYSGSNIDVCIIRTDPSSVFRTEYKRPYRVVGKKEPKLGTYKYPKKTICVTREQVVDFVDVKIKMEL